MKPQRRTRLIYAAALSCAVLPLGLICAAPHLAVARHERAALTIYTAFASFCHQLPERSFHWREWPLAVCARCTGIYAGFVAGALLYPWLRNIGADDLLAGRWLVPAVMPMIVDAGGAALGLFTNNCLSRAATGGLAGAAAAFFLLSGLSATGHESGSEVH